MGAFVSLFDKDVEENLQKKAEWNEISMKKPYIAFIIISVLILVPLGASMTYNYYLKRNRHLYSKRRPGLVIVFNIVALLYIGIYTPIHILVFEISWDNNGTYSEYWEIAVYSTLQQAVFLTFVLRIWHSFHDFKVARATSTKFWKSIIKTDLNLDEDQSFIMVHKEFLGTVCLSTTLDSSRFIPSKNRTKTNQYPLRNQ